MAALRNTSFKISWTLESEKHKYATRRSYSVEQADLKGDRSMLPRMR